MNDLRIGHAAFHPYSLQGVTPQHLRGLGNLPPPPLESPNEELRLALKNAHKFGLLIGALEGLMWQVDATTRAKIEVILAEVRAE